MRILYGVQGTGNGHISRCRLMAKALKNEGVQVDYIFSGRDADAYFDMQEFGDYRCLSGLSFATKNGAINLWSTINQSKPLQLLRDIKHLSLDDYDSIISDFEPVTAWAAKRQNLPVLGISHQASFRYAVPQTGGDPVARFTMRNFAPVQQAVGLHWFHFGYPILPPIIESLKPGKESGDMLVYLPFESPHAIYELLSRFKSTRFICFHPDFSIPVEQNNLRFMPLGRESFIQVLRGCEGVICNAGFELASEALTLGKRLLLKPLQGQFEQASNAMTLELLGLAIVMQQLDPGQVRHWLNSEKTGSIHYPDVASAVAAWLASGRAETVIDLADRLWRQVIFPEPVMERIHELGLGADLSNAQLMHA
ncbi:MJ1255/VC2487 family glycosyltransferase [uncultured Tolumonas sp.]|uniref:MJ1255/VC2487 family glycosyltransferase n=1 Tax=uncultured Tolumonas sp. TaxID=263765 RepID=UPI002A0A4725|nr:MJ1255/VC2487 family glycosyltransferase [uncultured Tolumonas sp.]